MSRLGRLAPQLAHVSRSRLNETFHSRYAANTCLHARSRRRWSGQVQPQPFGSTVYVAPEVELESTRKRAPGRPTLTLMQRKRGGELSWRTTSEDARSMRSESSGRALYSRASSSSMRNDNASLRNAARAGSWGTLGSLTGVITSGGSRLGRRAILAGASLCRSPFLRGAISVKQILLQSLSQTAPEVNKRHR